MHPQRPLPLHRRLNRPLMRSVFCRPAASEAMPPPQAVRRRTTVTRAPRSRARLISATNSRRFVAKPRTPHPIPQAAQLFKCRSANVRGRGARPLVLSLGGLRGILSFEKESIPLFMHPCAAQGIIPPLCERHYSLFGSGSPASESRYRYSGISSRKPARTSSLSSGVNSTPSGLSS